MKFDLGELTPPKHLSGETFSGWKYFQPLKVHLAIC